VTPFLFCGFDVIPQAAEEINLPIKEIGRTLVFSVPSAMVFYTLVVLAIGVALPDSTLSTSSLPTADAMARAFNWQKMSTVLVIGGIGGILTTWNSFFIGGSRALFAMAEANMLPAFLARLHPKYKTPSAAVLLIGVCSVVAVFFGRSMLVWVSEASSFGAVVAYFIVAASFLRLRYAEPDMERPYKVKSGVFIGIMACLMALIMFTLYMPGLPSGLSWQEQLIVGIWIVLGVLLGGYAKVKYGPAFGQSEGLWYPRRLRRK
jgi:amino acid transporter